MQNRSELPTYTWGEDSDLEFLQARLALLTQELRSASMEEEVEPSYLLSVMSQLQVLFVEHQWKMQSTLQQQQQAMESMSRVTLYLVSSDSKREILKERLHQFLFASIVALGSIVFAGFLIAAQYS